MDLNNIKPYKNNYSKKEQIEKMFDDICNTYDLNNNIISLGMHKIWKRKVVNIIIKNNYKNILDIATGTADLPIMICKKNKSCNIIGMDISNKMIEESRKKINKYNLQHKIQIIKGDAENINFESNKFDCVTVSFGIRNFENIINNIKEVNRVIKDNGAYIILEFSKPNNKILNFLYSIYNKLITCFLGGIISKNISAYKYLPRSIKYFHDEIDILTLLKNNGFNNINHEKLMLGIVNIYICKK